MFDACKCKPETEEKAFTAEQLDSRRKIALETYHVYESKLNKAKKAKVDVTNTLAKANKWITSKKLDKESMSKIGNAIKSIKSGNNALAKRLDKLLNDMGNPDDQLIPVTSEEIIQMINKELGNIVADNTTKNGEAYIFVSFNY